MARREICCVKLSGLRGEMAEDKLAKRDAGQLAKFSAFKKKSKLFAGGLAIGLLIGVIATFVAFTYNPPDKEPVEPEVNVAVLLADVKQINELATASETYTVVEKVEKKNDKLFDLIDIPFTDNFFILAYTGTIKAGVNLEQAEIAPSGKTVKVLLPQPTILSDTLNTDSFEVLHEQSGVFSPIHVDDVTEYLDKSQQEAEAAAVSGSVLQEAQENAKTSVQAIIEAALPEGYTVEVEFPVEAKE